MSVKNEKMKRLDNMNFFAWSKLIIFKYKIIILHHRHEYRQDFNVCIKQYNTETGYLRLILDSRRRQSEEKQSNSLAKTLPRKSYEARLQQNGCGVQETRTKALHVIVQKSDIFYILSPKSQKAYPRSSSFEESQGSTERHILHGMSSTS